MGSLRDLLPDWTGRRAFVVGGGPSLRRFRWYALRGEAWIGCNISGMRRAPVALAADKRFVETFGSDPRWHPSTVRLWQRQEIWNPPDPWHVVECAPPEIGWGRVVDEGIVRGPCTGIAAVNLAEALGADPIYLLGFDMRDDEDAQHWHGEYSRLDDEKRDAGTYDRTHAWVHPKRSYVAFREQFERWAPRCHARVVNMNPASGLEVWPRHAYSVVEGRIEEGACVSS